MADDPATILLSDTDDSPLAAEAAQNPAKRGRGRPKGSGTKASAPGERLAGVNEMADVLSKLLGLASVLLAFALVGQDYAKVIALEPGEARDIAEPAARLLRKSGLARQASALVTKGGDVIALTTAVAGYLIRVGPMVAEIQAQRLAAQRGVSREPQSVNPVLRPTPSTSAGPSAGAGASQPASNGHAVGVPFGLTDPDSNAFANWSAANLGNAFPPTANN